MKVNFFPHFVWNNWRYTPRALCCCQRQRHPTTATGPLQISWLRPCEVEILYV